MAGPPTQVLPTHCPPLHGSQIGFTSALQGVNGFDHEQFECGPKDEQLVKIRRTGIKNKDFTKTS